MFYDMNKIVADELAAINYMLEAVHGQTEILRGTSAYGVTTKGPEILRGTSLYGNATAAGTSYHLRYIEDGRRKSRLLGDDFADEVIRIKQLAYNKELTSCLEHNRKLLERVDGKFRAYDAEGVDSRLRAIYRDTTGLVNKTPGLMGSEEWLRQEYSSTLPSADKRHITADGKMARSKSEIVIHNLLTQMGIPFKKDVDINLHTEADERIYKNADFVMPCKEGGYIVLEHFGMLDNEEYLL